MQQLTGLAKLGIEIQIKRPEGYSGATATLPVLELVEGIDGQLGEEFCA
jgi:hypothetical protein